MNDVMIGITSWLVVGVAVFGFFYVKYLSKVKSNDKVAIEKIDVAIQDLFLHLSVAGPFLSAVVVLFCISVWPVFLWIYYKG